MHLAHWEFLGLAIGHLLYVQLVGGANSIPTAPAEWITATRDRVTPSAFNFILIGETTSTILNGKSAIPETGPMIQLPVPLLPNDSLNQVHSACCEAILSLLFHRSEPELLDRLLLYENNSPGILQSTYYPFLMAQIIYSLSATGKLRDASKNLKVAEKLVEKVQHLNETLESSSNFRKCFMNLAISVTHLYSKRQVCHTAWLRPVDWNT